MQPSHELTLHPVDLTRHGLNPYGGPLYRVVWADTRTSKVICHGKTYVLPRYVHGAESDAKGKWVLEKWAPPEVVVGMTREQYEAFLAGLPGGAVEEYPERGEYELARVFNEDSGPFAKHIDEVALHKQLEFHNWNAARKTVADRVADAQAEEEKKDAVHAERFEALYEQAREENLCLSSQ